MVNGVGRASETLVYGAIGPWASLALHVLARGEILRVATHVLFPDVVRCPEL